MTLSRRRFAATAARLGALAGLGGLAHPASLMARSPLQTAGRRPEGSLATHRVASQDLRVDGNRLNGFLDHLSRFGRNDAGGIDRVAYSDADLEARAWVRERMLEAGLDVVVDGAGNLLGRAPGTDPELPSIWLGSHIDSVPGGGNYDGQVGSMAALEVAHKLHDAGVRTRHPLTYVIFQNEEGGKTGSRALVGRVEPFELDLETASGYTIGQGIERLGGNPGALAAARLDPGDVAAFLELHIEQGAVLDQEGYTIGVVEGIVGIRRWTVSFEGHTNHAGTTPMPRRRDALVAAARFIDSVNRIALDRPGRHVATVGRISVEPGAPNVIPGRVTCSLEIRDLSMESIDALFQEIRAAGRSMAEDAGIDIAFERFYESLAAPTEPAIRDVIQASASKMGLPALRMPSGAGHDAQSMAEVGPVGMIFVPSVEGISHSPDEFSRPADITAGANVLLATLLTLDDGT